MGTDPQVASRADVERLGLMVEDRLDELTLKLERLEELMSRLRGRHH